MSPNTFQIVQEAENIHNKMIFDSVNEALSKLRTKSMQSINRMPWSAKPTQRNTLLGISDFKSHVIETLEYWNSVEAGKIPGNE